MIVNNCSVNYIPSGESHVSPYLIVKSGNDLIAFLQNVFNAKITLKHGDIDGNPLHAQVKIKDSTVMIGTSQHDSLSINPSMLHVYVENVEETMEKALQHGAELTLEIKLDEDAGDKRGMFKDPTGNYWAIATHIS